MKDPNINYDVFSAIVSIILSTEKDKIINIFDHSGIVYISVTLFSILMDYIILHKQTTFREMFVPGAVLMRLIDKSKDKTPAEQLDHYIKFINDIKLINEIDIRIRRNLATKIKNIKLNISETEIIRINADLSKELHNNLDMLILRTLYEKINAIDQLIQDIFTPLKSHEFKVYKEKNTYKISYSKHSVSSPNLKQILDISGDNKPLTYLLILRYRAAFTDEGMTHNEMCFKLLGIPANELVNLVKKYNIKYEIISNPIFNKITGITRFESFIPGLMPGELERSILNENMIPWDNYIIYPTLDYFTVKFILTKLIALKTQNNTHTGASFVAIIFMNYYIYESLPENFKNAGELKSAITTSVVQLKIEYPASIVK